MEAQNLTISIPADKCDKNCEYCISTITWQPKRDHGLMIRNMHKVKRLANVARVTNVLVTSKKETFLGYSHMLWVMEQFKDYWLEVQTNGIQLNKYPKRFVGDLVRSGVNVVAFSIDDIPTLHCYMDTFKILSDNGIVVRVCINLTKKITDHYNLPGIMAAIMSVRFVRQVLFRNINYPSTAAKNNPSVKWIDKNVDAKMYRIMYEVMISQGFTPAIRTIPHTGVAIHDWNGISVCFSDYCLQETNKTDDIRSLILHQDGHLYTSWDSPASILF
jgi:hypothetical protein